jgi:hypothetical protein
MHIYRLAQFVGPGVRTMPYIGPLESIPAGWSIVTRRSVSRPHSPAPVTADSLPCRTPAAAVVGECFRGDVA